MKDYPQAQTKKRPQPPLERIERAIAQGHPSAFDRAMEDLWASGDKFGNWQHRVLGLLIALPRETRELYQSQWMGKLFSGPTPPVPTAQENFLGLVYKRKLWEVAPILIAAGFTSDPSDLLVALLEMPGQDRGLQFQLMQSLLESANAPNPSQHRHLVEQVIAKEAFHLLPALHRAGFSIDPSPDYERKMAAALGRGVWSYPDLIMPKLMESSVARDAFCQALSVSLVGRPGGLSNSSSGSSPGFLSPDHVARFCSLHVPKRISLRSKIHLAILEFGKRNNAAAPPPGAAQSLLTLSRACLVDIPKLERASINNPATARLLAPAIAQMQFEEIQSATPILPSARCPSRRI